MGGLGRRLHMNPCWLIFGFAMFAACSGMPAPRRLAFLGGAVCRAAAADAPLDPGAVRQALATVALGAFVLGACCACACAAACWCASIAYDADGGGGGPFSARRVLAALGAKEPPRRYARVRLNEDDATGGDIEMTLA